MNEMMTEAIYVDTTDRDLPGYAVSITATPEGIVLRYATELPRVPFNQTLPFIIPVKGYEAQSSAGHVDIIFSRGVPIVKVVGACGFPWAKSLRPIKPFSAVVMPQARLQPLRTHENSNSSTAGAVGLLEDTLVPGEVLILEGQSDYTSAILVTPLEKRPKMPKFREEHRQDIISKKGIALAIAKSELKRYSCFEGVTNPWERLDGSIYASTVLFLFGITDVAEEYTNYLSPSLAKEIVAEYEEAGWTLSYQPPLPERGESLDAISPQGNRHLNWRVSYNRYPKAAQEKIIAYAQKHMHMRLRGAG